MSNITNNIFSTISMLTDKTITSFKPDKCITGIVVSVENTTTGEYGIEYNSIRITAKSIGNEQYNIGDVVYLLIPDNDFENTKFILGLTSKTNVVEENSVDKEFSLLGSGVVLNRYKDIEFTSFPLDTSTTINKIQWVMTSVKVEDQVRASAQIYLPDIAEEEEDLTISRIKVTNSTGDSNIREIEPEQMTIEKIDGQTGIYNLNYNFIDEDKISAVTFEIKYTGYKYQTTVIYSYNGSGEKTPNTAIIPEEKKSAFLNDLTALESKLKDDTTAFIVSANFKSNFPNIQTGTFGIKVKIKYNDGEREYIFSSSEMQAENVYMMLDYTEQKKAFENINSKTFEYITEISIFNDLGSGLGIKDVEIYGAKRIADPVPLAILSIDSITGVTDISTLKAEDGEEQQKITLKAVLKDSKQKVIQNVTYTWYQENVTIIDGESEKGGAGWAPLLDNNIDNQLTISDNSQFLSSSCRFKCVATTSSGMSFDAYYTLYNEEGINLSLKRQNDVLTCEAKKEEETVNGLSYQWFYKLHEGTTWNALSNTQSLTVNPDQIPISQEYRCVVSDEDGLYIGYVEIKIFGSQRVSIRDIKIYYMRSNSSTKAPSADDPDWQETVPEEVGDKKWLWQKTVTIYEDGREVVNSIIQIKGEDGESAYSMSLDNDYDVIVFKNDKETLLSSLPSMTLSLMRGGEIQTNQKVDVEVENCTVAETDDSDPSNGILVFQIDSITDPTKEGYVNFKWTPIEEITISKKFTFKTKISQVDYNLKFTPGTTFNTSKADGAYYIQIEGYSEQNGVWILGPDEVNQPDGEKENDNIGIAPLNPGLYQVTKNSSGASTEKLLTPEKDYDAMLGEYEIQFNQGDSDSVEFFIKQQLDETTSESFIWDREQVNFVKDGSAGLGVENEYILWTLTEDNVVPAAPSELPKKPKEVTFEGTNDWGTNNFTIIELEENYPRYIYPIGYIKDQNNYSFPIKYDFSESTTDADGNYIKIKILKLDFSLTYPNSFEGTIYSYEEEPEWVYESLIPNRERPFLWKYSITKWSDGTEIIDGPGLQTSYVDKIVSVKQQWAPSDSDTEAPTNNWDYDLENVIETDSLYIWTRTETTYVSGAVTYSQAYVENANTVIKNWAIRTDETYINGAKIYTGSIDASKISVDDLSALEATIGGWKIGTDSIYSIENTQQNDNILISARNGDSVQRIAAGGEAITENFNKIITCYADKLSYNSSNYTAKALIYLPELSVDQSYPMKIKADAGYGEEGSVYPLDEYYSQYDEENKEWKWYYDEEHSKPNTNLTVIPVRSINSKLFSIEHTFSEWSSSKPFINVKYEVVYPAERVVFIDNPAFELLSDGTGSIGGWKITQDGLSVGTKDTTLMEITSSDEIQQLSPFTKNQTPIRINIKGQQIDYTIDPTYSIAKDDPDNSSAWEVIISYTLPSEIIATDISQEISYEIELISDSDNGDVEYVLASLSFPEDFNSPNGISYYHTDRYSDEYSSVNFTTTGTPSSLKYQRGENFTVFKDGSLCGFNMGGNIFYIFHDQQTTISKIQGTAYGANLIGDWRLRGYRLVSEKNYNVLNKAIHKLQDRIKKLEDQLDIDSSEEKIDPEDTQFELL